MGSSHWAIGLLCASIARSGDTAGPMPDPGQSHDQHGQICAEEDEQQQQTTVEASVSRSLTMVSAAAMAFGVRAVPCARAPEGAPVRPSRTPSGWT